MEKVTRAWVMTVALTAVTPLALSGCDLGGLGAQGGRPKSHASTAPPPALALTPAGDARNQPVSTEIGTTVRGGRVTEVVVTSDGKRVSGRMRPDGTAWVPDRPLTYGRSYTAKVTANGPNGQSTTKTTSFRTMASAGPKIESGLALQQGTDYGVAMPVPVEFDPAIPESDRAKVQRRMFVDTDPPQPGTWHWLADGSQAYYRAPDYWQPGTKISVRIALEGVPLSNGRYGDTDRRGNARIGDRLEMRIENATKRMTVLRDGKAVRRIPVSLGKASTPSSSGTMVVMEKAAETVFDTMNEPDPANRYRVDIQYAQRLTWGGEFIHAAPWSEYDQGERNVSHGCVNVSTANARWLFEQSKVGDPVTITGTETELEQGNGWTAWDMPWEEFVRGSALPVPANIGPKAGAAPSVPPVRSADPRVGPSASREAGPSAAASEGPSGRATGGPSTDPSGTPETPASSVGTVGPSTGRREDPPGTPAAPGRPARPSGSSDGRSAQPHASHTG